jgi:hypothetical protein
MQVYVEDVAGSGSFTVASKGWELVEVVENKAFGTFFELAVFTKKYEEGDPATYPVTWSGVSKRGCGALLGAWSGVSASEPINAHRGAASVGPSKQVVGPSIETTKPGCMLVMLGDYNGPDIRTIPPGMEEVAGPEGLIAQERLLGAEMTGTRIAETNKANGNIGYLVALAPEAEAPTVTGVSPAEGSEAGGTVVTISGTNFFAATAVKFGEAEATSVKVNSSGSITATSPAGTGTVDVTVTAPDGTSSISPADHFTYSPPPAVTGVNPAEGPEAGGTVVTISGTNFSGATAVKFGEAEASNVEVNSSGSITATSPVGTGTVDVTVVTRDGTSATSPADHFSYVPPPTVTKVKPAKGKAVGGNTVTITGTGFTGASAVEFGSVSATSFVIKSATTIKAVAPAETAGTVDITVTTPKGTSPITAADNYKFGAPTITGLSTSTGSVSGGTVVTVTGSGFAPGTSGTTFVFGKTAAASVNCSSITSCTIVTPAHAAGTVDVQATVSGAKSPKVAVDKFTFS